MISFGTPQSWPVMIVKNAFAQSETSQVFLPGMKKLFLLNLHVTVIAQLKPAAFNNKPKMKPIFTV